MNVSTPALFRLFDRNRDQQLSNDEVPVAKHGQPLREVEFPAALGAIGFAAADLKVKEKNAARIETEVMGNTPSTGRRVERFFAMLGNAILSFLAMLALPFTTLGGIVIGAIFHEPKLGARAGISLIEMLCGRTVRAADDAFSREPQSYKEAIAMQAVVRESELRQIHTKCKASSACPPSPPPALAAAAVNVRAPGA